MRLRVEDSLSGVFGSVVVLAGDWVVALIVRRTPEKGPCDNHLKPSYLGPGYA
jgi:hypothetical protein